MVLHRRMAQIPAISPGGFFIWGPPPPPPPTSDHLERAHGPFETSRADSSWMDPLGIS